MKSDAAPLCEHYFVHDGGFSLPGFLSQEISKMISNISRE